MYMLHVHTTICITCIYVHTGMLIRMQAETLRADISCQLCSAGNAEALRSEAVRQTRALLQDIVTMWLTDVSQLSSLVDSWCPDGSEGDDALFEGSETAKARRTQLLCNPHYKDAAPAVELLNKQVALLTAINMNGHPQLVQAADLDVCRNAASKASNMVLVTYALFLEYEKLPRISAAELRKAEISNFCDKLRHKPGAVPARLAARLKALAAE